MSQDSTRKIAHLGKGIREMRRQKRPLALIEISGKKKKIPFLPLIGADIDSEETLCERLDERERCGDAMGTMLSGSRMLKGLATRVPYNIRREPGEVGEFGRCRCCCCSPLLAPTWPRSLTEGGDSEVPRGRG